MVVNTEVVRGTMPDKDKPSWTSHLLDLAGKPITKAESKFFEAEQLKGWVVDAITYMSLYDQWASNILFLYVLQPGETHNPWSAEAKAQRQLKQWKKELRGTVIHIVVPDSEQKDGSYLAQPVLQDWLMYTPDSLKELHDAAKTEPERLRYRAAAIARTGFVPENFGKIK